MRILLEWATERMDGTEDKGTVYISDLLCSNGTELKLIIRYIIVVCTGLLRSSDRLAEVIPFIE